MGADLEAVAAALVAGPALIVAADTVVEIDGTALGKPRDATEGRMMLRTLAGREHTVHTAFCLRTLEGRTFERTETTLVRFYPLADDEIDDYVATGDGADKAGGYGIQGVGAPLVERIDGDYYNVMGFPLGSFVRSLPKLGWTLRLSETAKAGAA